MLAKELNLKLRFVESNHFPIGDDTKYITKEINT